jgi:hypothetical protein
MIKICPFKIWTVLFISFFIVSCISSESGPIEIDLDKMPVAKMEDVIVESDTVF